MKHSVVTRSTTFVAY